MTGDELRYWYKRLTKAAAVKPGEEYAVEDFQPETKKRESGIIYQYNAGDSNLWYSNPPNYTQGLFIPADEQAHIATKYFLLPGKLDGEQTLTVTISFTPPLPHTTGNRLKMNYRCIVQDEDCTPWREAELENGKAEQEFKVRIMKTGEQLIRLVLTPRVKAAYALPARLQVTTDSMSLAAKLYFENTRLKTEKVKRATLLHKGKRFLKRLMHG
jgi:hypothetical protein